MDGVVKTKTPTVTSSAAARLEQNNVAIDEWHHLAARY